MSATVTILGLNGRIGHAVAKAFYDAGWHVIGFGRENRTEMKDIEFIAGDAADLEAVRLAVAPADVVFNGLNLAYDKWSRGRIEQQLEIVLKALKGSGKTLLFPGNIYNYSEDQHLITPDTPYHPARDKGKSRVCMEEMLQRASQADGLQVIILRAGDFYGPGATGTFIDLALLSEVKKNNLVYPGDPNLLHSWAYLPDLGRAYLKLAEERADLPRFVAYLYRGHVETGNALIAVARQVVAKPVKVKTFPWGLLQVIGLFVPLYRELAKMRYLWANPHQMRDERLDKLLGADFGTPFAQAARTTIGSFVAAGGPQTAAKSDAVSTKTPSRA